MKSRAPNNHLPLTRLGAADAHVGLHKVRRTLAVQLRNSNKNRAHKCAPLSG